ncbi:helix-turn-helix domain-containing protein [Streptomyces sp. NBC_01433]|uniref:PucR family transcriptional regulator n=1 Tax=Streptomyces sp. NBC_01433 TaxID=2903864 RepID=UPI002250B74E|nr:PucR family transcriptional regulator [Streptomyces sp. NBC_01433]MCX4682129.1 helix-turn-helix domain-containing protein [Streptomyces sp. NBC_01433]
MPTLGSVPTEQPELELTFAWPRSAAPHQAKKITGLTTLSLEALLESGPPRTLPAGALVLVTGAIPFRIRGRVAVALEGLLQQMALDECTALVVSAAQGVHQPFSQSIRDMSDQIDIPLLITHAPAAQWAGLHASIQKRRLVAAERRAAQFNALVQQMPAQLADPKAMQRIADWLARALDVQVLVSEPDRVLAASPPTAAEHLVQAIVRQSVGSSIAESPSTPHTQLISLAPSAGADTFLAVARRTPFEETDLRLLRHVAKLLGLIDQARREYRAAAEASHAARTAAVELLLDGEVDKARRVMANLAPGLLEPDTARLFVVESEPARRTVAVRYCETATAGHALVIADPREPGRILIIQPVRPGAEPDEIVAAELVRLVSAPGPVTSLGGSGVYSMSMLAEARHEASTAQRFALYQPDSVALSVQDTDLVGLLSQHEAQRWARHLLEPLMQDDQWEQLRETLLTALAYPYTVAARRLKLHRNTVTRRVARAAELLGMDFNAIGDRIAVGLALELVTHRELPAAPRGGEAPTLRTLLEAPQLHAWADTLLRPARDDRRDLLTTATAWLTFDAHLEPTARALGFSEVTVRSHLRALEVHTSRDLSSLSGIRDLQFALRIATGEPNITDGGRTLCAAA